MRKDTSKPLRQMEGEDDLGLMCPRCRWRSLPALYTRRLPNHEMARVRKCRKCGAKVLCKERMIGVIANSKQASTSDV
jgi:DNA-directed RNA polymerase subunit RPC12/RpoP